MNGTPDEPYRSPSAEEQREWGFDPETGELLRMKEFKAAFKPPEFEAFGDAYIDEEGFVLRRKPGAVEGAG